MELTMKCIQCGVELRPAARFCSACGAPQAFEAEQSQEPRGPVEPQPIPHDTTASGTTVAESDAAAIGRRKRPPRVLRTAVEEAQDDGEVPGTADAGEEEGNGTAAVSEESLPRPSVPAGQEGGVGEDAGSSPQEHIATARWDPDGFSWPLPLNIIKGGRYRVEAVVTSGADDETGENVYRVRDLQGYDRCWSCGVEYGATNAANTYCNQCGADLLAREYRMYERRLGASDPSGEGSSEAKVAETADANGVDPHERTFVEGQRVYRVTPYDPEPSPFPHGVRLLFGV